MCHLDISFFIAFVASCKHCWVNINSKLGWFSAKFLFILCNVITNILTNIIENKIGLQKLHKINGELSLSVALERIDLLFAKQYCTTWIKILVYEISLHLMYSLLILLLQISNYRNYNSGCSTVNLLHIFWTPFYKNTYGRLLLKLVLQRYM